VRLKERTTDKPSSRHRWPPQDAAIEGAEDWENGGMSSIFLFSLFLFWLGGGSRGVKKFEWKEQRIDVLEPWFITYV